MAMRRRAMRGTPAVMPAAMPAAVMKKGGKADMPQDKAMIKKAFKQHDAQEHKGGEGTDLKLKKGGKMATGGVTLGNGGGYKTGGVALGNGGGYKTGGVALGNGGGYKKGGATKKAFATGGTVNSGHPVAMPTKPASKPVRINELSGTFKKGGMVKMNDGGGASSDKEEDMSKGAYGRVPKHNRELGDALNPLSMVKELVGKAKDYFMPKGSDSVTKTKESVTVTPAKKRGGSMAC
jgi:hypothetical protein